ncbi:MAG: ATP-binding protein [Candidatus Tokpelaia sp.]|nr:MAG: ATP-binding protein [Candidatus Tokpelaia sp.]KAA6206354.1 MAG: ATP-binding protein [Candidatus Tokpelaia sp.]
MVSHIGTVAFSGVEALPVDVQVMIAPGKMSMSIVGLPDKTVAESRERVQAALHAAALSMPVKKVTINLAPADLPKEGSHYDLPIAVGLMAAMGVLPPQIGEDYIILGELALDGSISQVNGVLPAAMTAIAMGKGLICPASCGSEAAWAGEELDILNPENLLALANHFKGVQILTRPRPLAREVQAEPADLADIKGQETAKRALEVAAAGRHNILFVGPPGAGKSMLASRLPSILPPLAARELLDIAIINSIAGENTDGMISLKRPFRAPHHSASCAALIGGGLKARPGEISLAHNGVLFLDELPEFSPRVLDSLRQPLESGQCVIARANHHVTYPAAVQLVAAMNPCRCGMAGEDGRGCGRQPRCRADYQARISGPLLDRIDLRIDVPALTAAELLQPAQAESSTAVAARVLAARARQKQRFIALGTHNIIANGDCPAALVEKMAVPDKGGAELLRNISEKRHFSARAYHRVLKVARTIADLDKAEIISRKHLAEALAYRLGSENLAGSA